MKEPWTRALARLAGDPERWRLFARHVAARFRRDQCLVSAGMLTYATLLALVPLMTVVLSIVAALPGAENWNAAIQEFIFRNFVPAARDTIEAKLTELTAGARTLTGVAGLFLVVTAVILMQNIEAAINRVFGVRNERSLVNRFMVYWSALTLGPILLGASLALSSYFFSLRVFSEVDTAGLLANLLRSLTPVLVSTLAFFVLFSVVPNRAVPLRHALIGAVLTAVLFELAKKGFGLYVSTVDTYTRLYGALAAIPIFLLWMYLAWSIILLGASFTASLSSFNEPGDGEGWPRRLEFLLLLRVLARLAAAHRRGLPLELEDLLAAEKESTDEQLQRLLDDLQDAGLVTRDEAGRWLLARDLATVTVQDAYDAGDYPWPPRLADAEGSFLPAEETDPRLRATLEETQLALEPFLSLPLAQLFEPRQDAREVRDTAAA